MSWVNWLNAGVNAYQASEGGDSGSGNQGGEGGVFATGDSGGPRSGAGSVSGGGDTVFNAPPPPRPAGLAGGQYTGVLLAGGLVVGALLLRGGKS